MGAGRYKIEKNALSNSTICACVFLGANYECAKYMCRKGGKNEDFKEDKNI